MAETISRSIFKAYDIRGIVDKTLTEEVCEKVGMALGTPVSYTHLRAHET